MRIFLEMLALVVCALWSYAMGLRDGRNEAARVYASQFFRGDLG